MSLTEESVGMVYCPKCGYPKKGRILRWERLSIEEQESECRKCNPKKSMKASDS